MSDLERSLPLAIDVRSVRALLDSDEEFLLLDCREPDEYEVVHIEQAKLVPMSQIVARLAELTAYKTQRIVVHCHHGGRSFEVTNWLRHQGCPHAQNMTGGIDAWACEIDKSLPRY